MERGHLISKTEEVSSSHNQMRMKEREGAGRPRLLILVSWLDSWIEEKSCREKGGGEDVLFDFRLRF